MEAESPMIWIDEHSPRSLRTSSVKRPSTKVKTSATIFLALIILISRNSASSSAVVSKTCLSMFLAFQLKNRLY